MAHATDSWIMGSHHPFLSPVQQQNPINFSSFLSVYASQLTIAPSKLLKLS